MVARVSTSAKKRLIALEQRRKAKHHNRPVAMFPRLVSVDEWEAIAASAQQRLKANVKEDGAVDYSGIPELELVPYN